MTTSINATELLSVGNIIDGRMTDSERYRDVVDPGQRTTVVARVAIGTPTDVDVAVSAAHRAFGTWRHVPVAERAALLFKAAEIVGASAEELAPLLVREHGGVLWEAQTDFALGSGVLQHTASLTEDFFAPANIDDDQSTIRIEKIARGVVAAIVPWNMPVVLTMMKLAPALATGNTMVLKPSPFASVALTLLLQKISEILPEGVLNVVHGDGDVGSALTSHPLVRKIGFTGGLATASAVMASASETVKNITLELGGNDPAIVLEDADIEKTLDRLLGGIFTRSGQICFAVKRVYVPAAMHDAFAEALIARVDKYIVGHGLEEGVTFGPLATEAQYQKVAALIESTKQSGSDVVELGSKAPGTDWANGWYILPHVVRNAAHEDVLTSCEQFGPIIPLIPYTDLDQAIEWANDSEYGLGSSVWATDIDKAFEVASRIDAGSTFINSHAFDSLDLRMPFGGIKQSGIGREFGSAGLSEYVEEHAIRLLK
jgi:acyl-CoA reductase-like NAD-dependent aldehyde dehydrogenase